MSFPSKSGALCAVLFAAAPAGLVFTAAPALAGPFQFTVGDLVVSTVTCSAGPTACSGTSGALDTASPITLTQFQLNGTGTAATMAGSLVLPQITSGANFAISGEYGSASEGILQQSANGQYLTIMGYGVGAADFNANGATTYGNAALGQSTSLATGTNGSGQSTGTGGAVTVPRVVALIGANGSVDTSTALTGVFNQNNPRSVATADGTSFYVSGQGTTGDGTGGVFLAAKGATTATAINANTTTPTGTATANAATATETRTVEISSTVTGNNTLYVSRDYSPSGTPNDSTDIRSLTDSTGGLPTSSSGLAATRLTNLNPSATGKGGNGLGGNDSSINVTSTLVNGVNNSRSGKFVYLSPEQFFFANSTTMYIADSGAPKNGGAGAAALGEGGLQKWSLVGGVWVLDYDLYAGLNLVNNATANSAIPTGNGVTGLFGLTGEVVGGKVELFATSYGLNELSTSYLYEITDNLADTTYTQVLTENANAGESFTTLASSTDFGGDTLIRGVAFAPTSSASSAAVPEPASMAVLSLAFAALARLRRRHG